MLVDENGDLVLVNVSSDHSGHYQCQTNESGTIINGSSYELTVQNSMGSLDGEEWYYLIIIKWLLIVYSVEHKIINHIIMFMMLGR